MGAGNLQSFYMVENKIYETDKEDRSLFVQGGKPSLSEGYT